MKKRRIWLWAAAILAAASGAVVSLPKTDTPADQDVRTVRVERGTLRQTVVATGVVRPVVGAEINVGSRISGTVRDLKVRVGDFVEAGDLLAELDATGLDAAVEEARAGLELARAELVQARTAFERRRHLEAEGVVATADVDLARRDLDVAAARVTSAEERLRAAEINRGYARITAPIRGVVATVTTREGETVAASFASPTFVTILDLDRLEVRTFVDETDIGRVFVGQKATFTVDTYPDVDIAAHVTSIEPKAEVRNSVVNYVVVLDFERSGDVLVRPEMTAHVSLTLGEREGALTLPRETLRHRDGRRYVSVRCGKGWTEQEVKTGWRTDRAVEILDGLAEGDVVRVNPQ